MTNKSDWNPCEEFKDETIDCRVLCKEPPCSKCLMWGPYKIYNKAHRMLTFSNIICCTSENMEQDFSCFVSKNPGGNNDY